MASDADIIDRRFHEIVTAGKWPEIPDSEPIDGALLWQLAKSQFISRHLDIYSRKLQAQGQSYYTIGSSGHEGNAAIAASCRPGDMAFLHYRDAAFMIQRSTQVPGQQIIRDMLRSFTASSLDPISGGRHKVLGSKALNIPPQTSTIASHLPKAVGAAVSIAINKRLQREAVIPADSVIVCSFGDASLNHSTAQGAINTASWMAYQKMHVPILFVCEDNGLGISVPTPSGWVKEVMNAKPGIRYFACDGRHLAEVYQAAGEASDYVRKHRMPAFLHMSCSRLLGHAGSDVQQAYLPPEEIERQYENDPLLFTAALLVRDGVSTPDEIIALYESVRSEIDTVAKEVITEPKLETAQEVMRPLIPPVKAGSRDDQQKTEWKPEASDAPQPMSALINATLQELMHEHDNIILAGEDIGRKGGVYGITKKLKTQFGAHRVIDTLLDEQTILGMAIGFAHNDLLPIVEIQFLAYLHNAEDQLRGEAATLSFFSNGQYTNPMVVRIAGLAYQKGFGGHFHNDNSLAVLRDIPGIVVACPSHGKDAVAMLKECVRLAWEEQRVVVFVEPIALYHTRDLHREGDEGWCSRYHDARRECVKLGAISVYGEGGDLCLISYGNGVRLCLQAAEHLATLGIKSRVVDLRWINPLPAKAAFEAARGCRYVLMVDECRKTGSPSEELVARFAEMSDTPLSLARHCAEDSFIPLGAASTLTLPSRESIIDAALSLTRGKSA